jgi:hypothetical protein
MQHLDGDVAVVLRVVGEVDRGHPAGAEFAFDAVAVSPGGVQTFEHGTRWAVREPVAWRGFQREDRTTLWHVAAWHAMRRQGLPRQVNIEAVAMASRNADIVA